LLSLTSHQFTMTQPNFPPTSTKGCYSLPKQPVAPMPADDVQLGKRNLFDDISSLQHEKPEKMQNDTDTDRKPPANANATPEKAQDQDKGEGEDEPKSELEGKEQESKRVEEQNGVYLAKTDTAWKKVPFDVVRNGIFPFLEKNEMGQVLLVSKGLFYLVASSSCMPRTVLRHKLVLSLAQPMAMNDLQLFKGLTENRNTVKIGQNWEVWLEIAKGNRIMMKKIFRHAVDQHHMPLVMALARHGANVIDRKNKAVKVASRVGNLECVQLLIDKGADINEPLRCEAENGRLPVVMYLVEKGADIKADNNYAIRFAASEGRLSVVIYLAENGADITAEYNYAVRCAAENGHIAVVKFLVEQGADFTADDNYALRWAAKKGKLEVVKFLVENGADVTALDNEAVCGALRHGQLHVVQYLTEWSCRTPQ